MCIILAEKRYFSYFQTSKIKKTYQLRSFIRMMKMISIKPDYIQAITVNQTLTPKQSNIMRIQFFLVSIYWCYIFHHPESKNPYQITHRTLQDEVRERTVQNRKKIFSLSKSLHRASSTTTQFNSGVKYVSTFWHPKSIEINHATVTTLATERCRKRESEREKERVRVNFLHHPNALQLQYAKGRWMLAYKGNPRSDYNDDNKNAPNTAQWWR